MMNVPQGYKRIASMSGPAIWAAYVNPKTPAAILNEEGQLRVTDASLIATEVELRIAEGMQPLPNEPLTAKSEPYSTLADGRLVRRAGVDDREPCPECGKLSELEDIGVYPLLLSCGCKTWNTEWLKRAFARTRIPTEVLPETAE